MAFISDATNLVEGDTNFFTDIFRKDTQTGEVLRVNVSAIGTQADYGSDSPSISADGRYVAFASNADNLIAGDAYFPTSDIFVKDLATGEVSARQLARGIRKRWQLSASTQRQWTFCGL